MRDQILPKMCAEVIKFSFLSRLLGPAMSLDAVRCRCNRSIPETCLYEASRDLADKVKQRSFGLPVPPVYIDDAVCEVCQKEEDIRHLDCAHKFCTNCLEKYLPLAHP